MNNRPMDLDKAMKEKEKYEKLHRMAADAADVVGGIPLIGGPLESLAHVVSKGSKGAVDKIDRQNPNRDNSYFVLETSGFYDNAGKIVEKILEDPKMKELHNYETHDYCIEMWDDFFEFVSDDMEENRKIQDTDISYFIYIEFQDDIFSYKDNPDRLCSVSIQFMEKFKQIDFTTKKVYSAFEIVSNGYTPEGKRKYDEISKEIVVRLCNNLY